MVAPITGRVPDPASARSEDDRHSLEQALSYMDLKPLTAIQDIQLDRVFIGSCTNCAHRRPARGRRGGARQARASARAGDGRARLAPGQGCTPSRKGLDRVFTDAGFDWREAGCSMCLGMNPDILQPGERCASTSNRNFEGRQGKGGRTHLVSPPMAAAAAIAGHFVDIRDWKGGA